MCQAFATTWWWKSVVGLGVGITIRWQGGIVKFNLKEVGGKILIWGYELHIRLTKVGRGCKSKQSLTLPETLEVNVEDIWDEGCCSYFVRSDRYITNKDELLKQ